MIEKKRRCEEEGGKKEEENEEERNRGLNDPGEVPASVLPAVKLPMLQHFNAQPSPSKPPLDLIYRPMSLLSVPYSSHVLGGSKLHSSVHIGCFIHEPSELQKKKARE